MSEKYPFSTRIQIQDLYFILLEKILEPDIQFKKKLERLEEIINVFPPKIKEKVENRWNEIIENIKDELPQKPSDYWLYDDTFSDQEEEEWEEEVSRTVYFKFLEATINVLEKFGLIPTPYSNIEIIKMGEE